MSQHAMGKESVFINIADRVQIRQAAGWEHNVYLECGADWYRERIFLLLKEQWMINHLQECGIQKCKMGRDKILSTTKDIKR